MSPKYLQNEKAAKGCYYNLLVQKKGLNRISN
jgi:hypothetical protein